MQANDTAHAGNLEFKWLKNMQEKSANTVGWIKFNNVEKCSQFLDPCGKFSIEYSRTRA